jgi:gliding motility-associated-like protein
MVTKSSVSVFAFILFLFLSTISWQSAHAQTPGLIYKPAVGGAAVLDPNGDGYSSVTTAGFISNDETESEIPFVPLPIVAPEPDSDLGPGPNCGFTDLVKSSDNETLYTYSDGTNLYFRFRLGGTASNSKGYSIWVDTDQAFGAIDPNSDPNYVVGNPGFEVEISLQTNFGVGVYDIDGTTTPVEYTAPSTLPYDDYCQKSIALSTECGDADYFYDFYVPYANLPFTSSTPVRMIGTTVINPHAGTGNNGISDLGGVDDATGTIDDLAGDLIDITPPTSGDDIAGGGEILPRASCPGIDGPIAVGATTVTGTSSEADGATIEVFKDAVSVGTTTVTGGIWSITGLTALVATEEITATATVTAVKSTSIANCNPVTVGSTCSDTPTGITVSSGTKGLMGSSTEEGATVSIYTDAALTTLWTGANTSDPNPGIVGVTGSTAIAGSWEIQGTSGGSLSNGIYYVTVQAAGECESAAAIHCQGVTGSAAPTISTSPIVSATTSIAGTLGATPTGASTINLYIDGVSAGFSTTTSTTSWTITGISGLVVGQVVTVVATESGECPSESVGVAVQGQSLTPIISGTYCTSTTISTVSGISSETPGSTITLYTKGSAGVTTADTNSGSTTVAANGSWSVTALSLSAGTFMAATAQTAGELESNLSNEVEILSQTIDGSLSITTDPITEGDASVSGTGTAGNVIQLYIDDVIVDGFTTVVTGAGTWTISGLDAASAGYDVLYAESTTQVSATNGALCESALANAPNPTVCNPPITQTFTPVTAITDCETEAITFQLAATENLVVYQLIDQLGNSTGGSLLGNGGALNISTGALTTSMTSISVKALRIGITCETIFGTTAINVNPLPTITLGANPSACFGDTSTSLTYSATSNSPNEYSIDFDATATGQGFADVLNSVLPASPITIIVPGTAIGGIYNANLTVTNTTTGCTSVVFPITITVIQHSIVQGAVTHPTACGASDGIIQLTGLLTSTSFSVDYTDNGVAAPTAILSSDGSGNLNITGLGAGSYTNISVTESTCQSNILAGPVTLTDPASETIFEGTHTQPTNCAAPDGKVQLTGLTALATYTVYFLRDGVADSQISAASGAGVVEAIGLDVGTYTNIYVTDVSSCTSNTLSGPVVLTISTPPTVTFTAEPGATACTGVDVTYTTQAGQSNYVWTFPGTITTDYTITSGGGTGDNTAVLNYVTTGSKTVTVNYDNAGGCSAASATSSTATTVSAPPTVTFTAEPGATACTGVDVTYTTQAGQSNYVWTFPGTITTDYTITSGGGTGDNTAVLNYVTTGSKTVTVNYDNAGGCSAASATSSTATTVSAPPTVTFTAEPGATACTGVDVTYTTQAGQSNYVWTFPGTITTDYTITSGGGTGDNSAVLNYVTTGSKTVTVNYDNAGGCSAASATSSTATTISAPPTVTFTAEPGATACTGVDVTYTTQAGQSNYVWTFPGTITTDYTITSGGGTGDNSAVLNYVTTGSKTVTVNYDNAGGCSAASATSSTATTISAPPTVTFTAEPGATACTGVDVTYTTQAGQSNYVWTFPGTITTDYTITSGGGTGDNSAVLNYVTTGSKTVTVNYDNAGGCSAASATSSTATTVSAPPTVTFTAEPGATACTGVDVTYTTQAGQSNYVWTFPGTITTDYTITSGGTATDNTVTLQYVTAGSKTVTVNYDNAGGCSAASATSSTATTVSVSVPLTAPTVTTQTTNDLTPTITGTSGTGVALAAGETMTVTVNGATYTVVPDASGNWSVDTGVDVPSSGVLGTFVDGVSYAVEATVTDTCGSSTSDATTLELTIDTTAPAVPTVVAQTTNDTTPIITGTAEAGSTVTIVVGGATYTTTANGSGDWTLDTGVAVPVSGTFAPNVNGTNEVAVTSTDAAGNSTGDATTLELTIDTTAPAVPTVVAQTTNDTTPIITGTAEAGSTVTIVVGGATYTTTANGSGDWTLDTGVAVPMSGTFAPNVNGTNEVAVTSTDAAGNSTGDATTLELTIDTTAPAVPTVVAQTTNDVTPTITGTSGTGVALAAGETMTVTVNGATYTVVPDASGNWSVDTGVDVPSSGVLAAFVDGVSYEVVATVTDGGGNSTSDSSSNEITIDTSAPTAPTVVSQTTNDVTPTITGTSGTGAALLAGETMTVTVNGATYTVVPNASGAWSVDTGVDVPSSGVLAAFVDGVSYEVVATVTDGGGNSTSDSSSNEITIDTSAPTAPTVVSQTTNDVTPTITGTSGTGAALLAGETMTVTVNGATYTVVPNASGAWSVDTGVDVPSSGVLAAFVDGVSYEVVATVTDGGGNSTSDATTNEVTIDTSAPTAPTVASQTTNDVTPTITGTSGTGVALAAGETMTVTVNGATYTVVPDASGNWSVDTGVDVPSSGVLGTFVDGVSYEVVATVTDGGGNSTSDATTNEVTIDTSAPTAPTVVSQTTNDLTPTITGTSGTGAALLAGETMTVTVNGATYTVVPDASGNWSVDTGVDVPSSGVLGTFVDGVSYEVVATVTDGGGNSTSDATTNEVTIDTSAPTAPTVASQTTNDVTPTITGTSGTGVALAAGETMTVTVNGATYSVVPDASGNWSVDTGVDVPSSGVLGTFVDGVSYEVVATVTDGGGNSTSDATTNEVTIDTSAPTAPTVASQTTNDVTPTITGTSGTGVALAAGETMTVTVNGATYSVVPDASGNWSVDTGVDVPSSGVLGTFVNGVSYEVVATVTDGGGNSTSDATTNEVTIDTSAPTAPTVASQTTNDVTPTITGTSGTGAALLAGETMTVTVNGATYTVVPDASGNWSVDTGVDVPSSGVLGTFVNGVSYEVVATVTDGGGNSTSDATTNEVTIDTSAPTAPTVASQTTNDVTPTITGTSGTGAALLAGETMTVTVNGATYTVVPDASGNWSVDTGVDVPSSGVLAAFVDGVSYEVVATVTDGGGNSTSDATTNEVTIDTSAPTAPTVVSQTTNDVTPTITGTSGTGAALLAGETMTVTVNGATYTVVPDASGNWSVDTGVDVPSSGVLGTFVDGVSYEVVATVTDGGGNSTSDATTNEVTIDTSAPTAPTVASQTTNDLTPTITGTSGTGVALAAGETMTVTVNGATYSVVPDASGNWSVDTGVDVPSSGVLGTFVDGVSYEVVATVTDGGGNSTSDATTNEVTIDTSAPTAPTVASQTTNDLTPTITGTSGTGAALLAGETMTVTVNGATYTVVPDASGNWSVDTGVDVPSSGVLGTFVDGVSYEVVATVTDGGGNSTSDATTNEVTIDTSAPTAPTVASQTTNDLTPTITGTSGTGAALLAGETMTVTVNGATYTVVPDASGNWSVDTGVDVPSSGVLGTFVDGVSYEVVATVTDGGGNSTSDATTNEVTIDTSAPTAPTVVSQTTNDLTPTITGTSGTGAALLAGETMTVTVNGATYTVVPDASGNWSVDTGVDVPSSGVLGTFVDGVSYEVVATVTDGGGNSTSDATTNEVTIDTSAPTAPTVVSQTTNDLTPTITGTSGTGAALLAGETMTVTVNGATYTVVPDASGNWSVDTGVDVPSSGVLGTFVDGVSYEVVATVTDGGGNSTSDATTNEVTIDTSAPTAPTVASQTTNDLTPTITGTSGTGVALAAGETMTVTVNGATYTVVPDASGAWSVDTGVDVPSSGVLAAFVDGVSYEVVATVTDGGGNSTSDSSSNEVTIDTSAPTAPTVVSQTTNDVTPTITGTSGTGAALLAGETMTVTVNGATYTVVPDASGNWSVDTGVDVPSSGVLAAFVDGVSYEVVATVTDGGGNSTSDSSSNEITIDTSAPTAPTVVSQTTNDVTPTITGTSGTGAALLAGETMTVVVNGATYTVVPDASGNWSVDTGVDVPSSGVLGTFVNGVSYEVVATVTDGGGNSTSDATTNEVTIDTSAPTAPTVASQTTNDLTPTITGTSGTGAALLAGETMTVTVNGATYTVVPDASGNWSVDTGVDVPSSGVLGTFVDGVSYEVVATVTDGGGNSTSDATTNEVTIDTSAPTAPTVVSQTTNDVTPTITGTSGTGAALLAGETMTVTVNGATYTVVPDASGNWSVDTGVDVPSSGVLGTFVDGVSYEVVATVTDGGGNSTSDATTNEVTIDTSAPTAPTVASQTTNDLTPTITGTSGTGVALAAGETMTVTVNGATYSVVPDASGNWSVDTGVDVPSSGVLGTFVDGVSYEVVATVTDGGGNSTSDATTNEVTIDTSAPTAPTVASQTTNDLTPTITGTSGTGVALAAGETMTVTVNGATYTVVPDASGNWSVDTGVDVPSSGVLGTFVDGVSYEVVATVTNGGGSSSSDGSSNEVTIDTTPPVVPTIVAQTTNDTTPTITGTAEAGSTVTIVVGGATYTTTANGSGDWTLDTGVAVPVSGTFAPNVNGTNEVAVTSTDAAGNSTGDATTLELTIDTTAPAVPTVVVQTTNDLTPTITGTSGTGVALGAGETMTVLVNGATYTVIPDASGNWSVDTGVDVPSSGVLGTFVDGVSYEVVATVTDDGGNSTVDVSSNEVTIDTNTPAVPTVTAQTTSDLAPTITGTSGTGVALLAGETMTVVVNGATYTVVPDASGNWSVDTGVDVPSSGVLGTFVDGVSYEVVATVTNGGGSSSSDGSSNEVTIDTTAPAVPTVVVQTTNDTTPIITGTAEAGSTVTIVVGGATYTTTANGSGGWTLDTGVAVPVSGTFAPNVNGTNEVAVTSTDAAGNSTVDATTLELTIDTTAPAAPTVTSLASTDGLPTVTGTWDEANATTLSVEVDGIVYVLGSDTELTTDGSGNWTLDLTGLGTPLADNTYDVVVVSGDAAGNTSTDGATNELVVNKTTDSEAVYTVNPALPTDSYSDGETVATVSDADGAIVSATLSSGTLPPGTALDPVTGEITVTDASLLVDGIYIFDITTTDVNGGVTVTTVTIEFTAPGSDIEAVYTVVGANPVDSYSNGDGLGTVTDADGAITSAVLANGTSLPSGVSLDPITGALTVSDASLLAQGIYTFDVTTTDANGGTTTQTVTLEFTAAGSDIEAVYTVNGSQPTDSYSNGDVVASVSDADGAITSAVINSGSLPAGMTMDPVTGEITVVDASLLVDGSYTLQITTTDVNGGTTVHSITIVLTAPGTDIEAVYTVNAAQSVDSYNNSDVLATVTDADGVITDAVVTAGSLPPGTAIAADGTITVVDATLLVPGSYTFDVTTTDINGEITVNSVTIVILPIADTDGDGVPDVIEDIDGDGDPTNDDTDGDGTPDYLDTDDDGDGVDTSDEDIDGDGDPTNDDTDGDGTPDYLDTDDDGDGEDTLDEDADGDGDPTNDDCDEDGTPNYLDTDFCGIDPSEGFSPGSGQFGVWMIDGIEAFPNNKVKVFNRWGNLVYETKGYNNNDNAWTGASNGKLLIGTDVPDGTYFYVIDLGDGSKPLGGYVIIKR